MRARLSGSEIKWKQTRGWSECLFYFIVLNRINERVNLPPQGKYFLMAGRNLYSEIKFMTNNSEKKYTFEKKSQFHARNSTS